MLYDGHGSVRHLADTTGSIIANQSYNYDAYGNALGFNPANADTSLLYTGEMYDTNLQQYYLRARWYSPANGRFNRMDPFAGSNQDPQSLHKYLYAHCNPINGIDPSGMLYIIQVVSAFYERMKLRTTKLVQTYKQYSRARKILTALGVAWVVSQAAMSYLTGGVSVKLDFSKCPLIRDREGWPDIMIDFTYRHNVNSLFKQLMKLKVTISRGEQYPTSGGGYVGIDVAGALEYDFVDKSLNFSGSFSADLKVPIYRKGPLELYSLLTADIIGIDSTSEDPWVSGFAWDLGLDLGIIRTESEGNKKDTILGLSTRWTILELLASRELTIFGFPL